MAGTPPGELGSFAPRILPRTNHKSLGNNNLHFQKIGFDRRQIEPRPRPPVQRSVVVPGSDGGSLAECARENALAASDPPAGPFPCAPLQLRPNCQGARDGMHENRMPTLFHFSWIRTIRADSTEKNHVQIRHKPTASRRHELLPEKPSRTTEGVHLDFTLVATSLTADSRGWGTPFSRLAASPQFDEPLDGLRKNSLFQTQPPGFLVWTR